jgi:deazaflavin-dependent oxidoreductase (nitroreductase family)
VATWENGNSYIVVASKGGVPQHPGWYRNILANPEVEVQVGTAKMKARARTAAGDERARLWERALEFWPPYADYQKKTEREIPVVVTSAARVKPFRKPTVDRSEKLPGFIPLVLIAPEPGHAHCGSSSSNFLASCRTGVPKPSVNHP